MSRKKTTLIILIAAITVAALLLTTYGAYAKGTHKTSVLGRSPEGILQTTNTLIPGCIADGTTHREYVRVNLGSNNNLGVPICADYLADMDSCGNLIGYINAIPAGPYACPTTP